MDDLKVKLKVIDTDNFKNILWKKIKDSFEEMQHLDNYIFSFHSKKDSIYDITISAILKEEPNILNIDLLGTPILIYIFYGKTHFEFYANERLIDAKMHASLRKINKIIPVKALEYINMLIVEILSAYVEATLAIATRNRIKNN